MRVAVSAALLGAVVLAAVPARAEYATFSKGSLIIPMQLNFQSPSGIPSAYGLVWRMLQKNEDPAWAASPVTIYSTLNPTKQSPNRCTPTDKDLAPTPSDDPRWLDGCDITITDSVNGRPVSKVDWAQSSVALGLKALDTFDTYNTYSVNGSTPSYDVRDPDGAGGWVCPAGTKTSAVHACTAPANTSVTNAFQTQKKGVWGCYTNGYAAGSFGACFLATTARCPKGYSATANASGQGGCAIASTGTCAAGYSFVSAFPGCTLSKDSCANGSMTATGDSAGAKVCAMAITGTSCTSGTYVDAFPGCVTAAVGITPAYTSKTVDATLKTVRFMGAPLVVGAEDVPAFLERMKSDPDLAPFWNSCKATSVSTTCHNVDVYVANADFVAPVLNVMNRKPPKIALLDAGNGVAAGSLSVYLSNAGLNFAGAGGCPVGTTSGCTLNGSTATKQNPGQIYDQFSANLDLRSTAAFPFGLLNAKDPATGKRVYQIFWAPHWVGSGTSAPVYDNGDGALTELDNVLNNITKFADDQTGMLAECASLETYEGSCTSSGGCPPSAFNVKPPAGTAASFMTQQSLYTNGLSTQTWVGRNCEDPDITPTAGATPTVPCVYYRNPADPYVQVADMTYQGTGGHVHNYKPQLGTSYNTSVRRLASTFSPSNGSDNDWDFFTTSYKDDNTRKGLILYLAGHSYGSNLAGNRITLNTLLNLGFGLISAETARVGPVPLTDPVTGKPAILQGSYEAVTVTGTPASYKNFNVLAASRWTFPFNAGHLRLHRLENLAEGNNKYEDASDWAAEGVFPAPQSRNVFTYLGGQANLSASAPNGVSQTGWTPVKFRYTALSPGNADCVDRQSLGKRTTVKKDGTTVDSWALVPGADSVCDLQEALELTALDKGTDFGTSTWTANKTALLADVQRTQVMVQMVRGHCYATGTAGDLLPGVDGDGQAPILEPTSPLDCNKGSVSENQARLGGIVNSAPVVVGQSRFVKNKDGKLRPVVAYAGGLDGQLHAFYVGGGDAYAGPTGAGTSGALPQLNTPAAGVFQTSFALPFDASRVKQGQELWSFIPPSQLPFLATNDAAVDGRVVVVDVFGDFQNSGTREWRTVLLGTSGPQGNDLFAMDVTNPLAPALLWFVWGSDGMKPLPRRSSGNAYFPVTPADGDLGFDDTAPGRTALFWKNTGFDLVAGSNVRAKYLVSGTDDGRDSTGLYNYERLGGAKSIQVGVSLVNGAPRFQAYVATNYGPATAAGLEVYAVDLVNGQKQWQWEQAYVTDRATRDASNDAPSGVALLDSDSDNFVDSLYVGDMEGRLWELETRLGMNRNVYRQGAGCSSASPCVFPLADTAGTFAAPQPVTTQPALFMIPAANNTSGPLAPYAGELAIAFGTGGAGFVAAKSPAVTGEVHLALLASGRRLDLVNGGYTVNDADHSTKLSAAQMKALADVHGIAQEPSPFPLTKDSSTPIPPGSRFYGPMTTVNGKLYFSTAKGKVGFGDGTARNVGGQTFSIDLYGAGGGALPGAISADAASTGTVLVVYDPALGTKTITTTTKGISVKTDADAHGRADANQKLINRTSPVHLMSWMRRLIYH